MNFSTELNGHELSARVVLEPLGVEVVVDGHVVRVIVTPDGEPGIVRVADAS